MSTTLIIPDSAVPADVALEALLCDMCPHELDKHDPISLRFCLATSAGTLRRGCICSAG